MSESATRLTRRALLAAASALLVAPRAAARYSRPVWRSFELAVPTDARGARRALVVLPAQADVSAPLPVLVLLHGLGETNDEHAGTHAWLERYGLGGAWERLSSPPLPRERPSVLSDAEHAGRNACLARRPFAGLCVVCPFLPHPSKFQGKDPKFERYASWLTDALLPAVRDRVPEATRSPTQTGLAGVSLGGLVALHAGLHRAEHYASVGSVQGAFAVEQAPNFARRLAASFRAPERSVYLATSRDDPYRAANQALVRELKKLGVPSELCLRGGPHSQPWLREIGSADLLLWHDRALRRASQSPSGQPAPGPTRSTDDSCCAG